MLNGSSHPSSLASWQSWLQSCLQAWLQVLLWCLKQLWLLLARHTAAEDRQASMVQSATEEHTAQEQSTAAQELNTAQELSTAALEQSTAQEPPAAHMMWLVLHKWLELRMWWVPHMQWWVLHIVQWHSHHKERLWRRRTCLQKWKVPS